jgi:NADH-quinone oxidoreductase subunit M
MPFYAGVFMVFMLASVGLPGTSGFPGEFLVMTGLFQVNTWVAAFICTGIILGAAYMLWLYRRVIFGELTKDSLKNILDLNRREVAVFAPLVATVLWMGIYPSSFFAVMEPSVAQLIKQYDGVRAAAIEDGTLSPDGPFALLSWNME